MIKRSLFILALITCFLAPIFIAKDTCCPDAWIPYRGSCYLFAEDRMDWNEARTYCHNRNSYLVVAETSNENYFLKYFARKLFKKDSIERNSTVFWLGASDQDIEGIWKWVYLDQEITYSDWSFRY